MAKARTGFTMLEILVATLLLVLGMIPIYNMFIAETAQVRFNKDRSLAAALAGRILTRLRQLPPAVLKRIETDADGFLAKDPIYAVDLDKDAEGAKDKLVQEWTGVDKTARDRFTVKLSLKEVDDLYKGTPNASRIAIVNVTWKEKLGPQAEEKDREFALAQVLASPFFPIGKQMTP